MEKRRRARINNCLVQLKSLVLQAMKKDVSTYMYFLIKKSNAKILKNSSEESFISNITYSGQ